MKSITIISEGYTYAYEFPKTLTETEFEGKFVEDEIRSSASESLYIVLDLLRCVFGKEDVKKALEELPEIDY